MRLFRIVGLVIVGALAGCNTAGRGIPEWQDAQRVMTWYYENNAWERSATCIPANMVGITDTVVVQETTEQLVLDVRYIWDVEGQWGEDVPGVPCFGQGQRTFVLAKHTGGGYSVVSMTGAQRS